MVVATATRRRADGGPSARSLLISILGQWVGPTDTPVWTAALVGALESLGIESRAARQAVNRTATDGWLEGESVGRYSRWSLTASGRRMIGSAVPRVQRSIVEDKPWDGTFLLLTLTGPTLDRTTRHRLAVGLDFEGFGMLGAGTWVAVGEGSREGAEIILDSFGLESRALLFRATAVEGAETPAEVVALAWDLDTAAAAHKAFLEEFEFAEPATEREAFALRTRMAHEWRHILIVDPSLPPELLPSDWAGTRARKVFQRRFSDWADAASSYYIRLSEDPFTS
ncbi:MAG: PaaX family transcriptional regulator C-terminal domain-containing protein [Acidimicrobiales bacterium]